MTLVGRPREFNEDKALKQAMDLFWRKGYEATSLQDLLEVIGLSKSSFYQTFANKHKLLERSIDHYRQMIVEDLSRNLATAGSGLQFIREMLSGVAEKVDQSARQFDPTCSCNYNLVNLDPTRVAESDSAMMGTEGRKKIFKFCEKLTMRRKTPGKEKGKKKKEKPSQPPEKRTFSHPVYGEIPLIQENNIWRCDPDFQPKMPAKAVRGNVHRQEFCYWCHFPKYFYLDEEHQCVDCGVKFLFSANEQKYWYEERKFNFYSKPIRCLPCRRKKRAERALKIQMTEATNAVKDNPNDPAVLLTYAEVTYEYFEQFGQGNLGQAIASARRAFELSPQLFEALYWEGVCQEAAGHFERAKQTYQHFLDATKPVSRYMPLLKQAEKRLEELAEFSVEEA